MGPSGPRGWERWARCPAASRPALRSGGPCGRCWGWRGAHGAFWRAAPSLARGGTASAGDQQLRSTGCAWEEVAVLPLPGCWCLPHPLRPGAAWPPASRSVPALAWTALTGGPNCSCGWGPLAFPRTAPGDITTLPHRTRPAVQTRPSSPPQPCRPLCLPGWRSAQPRA